MITIALLLGLSVQAAPPRDVSIPSGELKLPGTFALPAGSGPFPVVLMVGGSGPVDRDETIGPNKPFRDIAEGLASEGIATLRYDKRTRAYPSRPVQTVEDEVIDDAAAAAAWLRTQPEIDKRRIFILGHSMGGYLMPRIVDRVPTLAGAVILAGSVRGVLELVADQAPVVAPGADPELVVAKVRSMAPATYWSDLDSYRPAELSARQSVPLLILHGERDYNVPMTDYRLWQTGLKGRLNVRFRSFQKLNHLMMAGEGASTPAEYMKPGRVDADVIGEIATFVSNTAQAPEGKVIRVGIIGTDTSHVPAFTRVLNDPSGPDYIPGARVVAAYKGGSPDVESSHTRVDKFAEEIRTKYGVEIVPDVPTLLSKVDAVLIESVDGRPHLAQARAVIAAKKPFFVDKPLAATLKDAQEIARLAKQAGVPWFSSSSLRWSDIARTMKGDGITGAITWGPGPTEQHHQLDLAWYGIHAVETLFTLMGTGCEEVVRTATAGADEVTCRWRDGRVGTARLVRPSSDYGAVVFRGAKSQQSPPGAKFSYVPLVREIVTFFRTGVPPVPNEETLEIFAFMDAAQRSKESNGRPARLVLR